MRGSTPRAVLRVTGIMASSRRTSRSLLVSKLTNHNYATKGVLLCSVLEVTSMDFEREKKVYRTVSCFEASDGHLSQLYISVYPQNFADPSKTHWPNV